MFWRSFVCGSFSLFSTAGRSNSFSCTSLLAESASILSPLRGRTGLCWSRRFRSTRSLAVQGRSFGRFLSRFEVFGIFPGASGHLLSLTTEAPVCCGCTCAATCEVARPQGRSRNDHDTSGMNPQRTSVCT
eukprot:scaffold2858_cov659-Pavlova_lutheri.AAC.73